MSTKYKKLVVVGLGLMGASFAAGIKAANIFESVIGVDNNEDSRQKALELQICDEVSNDISVCSGADIVMLATPILTLKILILKIGNLQNIQNTIVTDVGSVKLPIVTFVKEHFANHPIRYVPGHPIAGSEKNGICAFNINLFARHKVVLTPFAFSDKEAIQSVLELWTILKAQVEILDAEEHDNVLAATSHLPHLLSFALVDSLVKSNENLDIFRYAAGGFRDFTRIAESDPIMWHDIFLSNKKPLLTTLDDFLKDLQDFKNIIEQDESSRLLNLLQNAKKAREYFGSLIAIQNKSANNKTMKKQQNLVANPIAEQKLTGTIRVPGDKSISHRIVILGSMSIGETIAEGFLESEDTNATAKAFKSMGVEIDRPNPGTIKIQGRGMYGLTVPDTPLYLGNSGTSMRLLSGLLAAQSFDSLLTGDESLSHRPMNRAVRPLREMGAKINVSSGGRPPLKIYGGNRLLGIDYKIPVASAQVKSCLLLAGMYAAGRTSITEPAVTRNHTELMLQGFGYPITVEGNTVAIESGGSLMGQTLSVPADFSSATFFMVAASIAHNADITLTHVGVNPTRTGALDILRLMGANIELFNEKIVGGEPVADIRIKSAELQGIEIPEPLVSLAIDEFPVLFIAAACAKGTTTLRGASELRVKESDRIASMEIGLKDLGINAQSTPDGIIIEGGKMKGAVINSFGDHRIAMSFVIASIRATEQITILDPTNIATSFPNFVDLARGIGLDLAFV